MAARQLNSAMEADAASDADGYTLFASVYDQWQQTYGAEYAYLVAPRVDERLAQLLGGPPRDLIDVACGTGTHALLQASRGVAVTGLDLSEAMLAVARAKAEAAACPIALVHADMRSFDLPKPVDAVTCLYASLNHLAGPADLTRTFQRVAAHLRPGGAFVFDLNTRAGFEALWRQPGTDRGPGLTIDRRYAWDDDEPWVAMHLTVERRSGETVERGRSVLRARWFEDGEVRTALAQAGLVLTDCTPFNPFPEVDRPGIKQLWSATRPRGG
ncbi:MAG: class I SAM-dependent methyltransferase [Chloroflexi bacterium]|nr:class I SAM-dependent methyltransferase [Chloroflexota bacterium]